jgi:hypothetical protein
MADLDFSHNVSQIPASQEIPQYKRTATTEIQNTPDVQSAASKYAADTNWMSWIGDKVATSANNQIAQQLGYEAGLKPHGNLSPAITNFDKVFTDAYNTQAHATLSMQADRLMTDAQIEMASANRLTPDLIAKSQYKVSQGLQSITEMAPTAIRGQMTSQLSAMMNSTNAQLMTKMFTQQREDQKDTILASSKKNYQTIQNLAMSGHIKEAEALANQTVAMAGSGVDSALINKQTSDTIKETAKLSVLTGVNIQKMAEAKKAGKLEEYLKNFVENDNSMTPLQKVQVGQSMMAYNNFVDDLTAKDRQLRLLNLNEQLVKNPMEVSGEQIADLLANVTPAQGIQAQIDIINAQSKWAKNQGGANQVKAEFSNPEVFGAATAKDINEAFSGLSEQYKINAQAQGRNVTNFEAQTYTALQGAGPITRYNDILNTKALSNQPQDLEDVSAAIALFENGNKLQNITGSNGLGQQARAKILAYNNFKNIMPAEQAAQAANELAYGQKSLEQKQANEQGFADYVSKNKRQGQTDTDFFIKESGISNDAIARNVGLYANQFKRMEYDYYNQFNQNTALAKQMLRQSINMNYGYTYINGEKEYTAYPLEKLHNMPENAAPAFHADMAKQLAKQFELTNSKFDEGKTDYRFEIKPIIGQEELQRYKEKTKDNKRGLIDIDGYYNLVETMLTSGVEVLQIGRDGKSKKYTAVLVANPESSRTTNPDKPVAGGYQVQFKTESGDFMNIYNVDPMAGTFVYQPDMPFVREYYTSNIAPAALISKGLFHADSN